MPCLRPFATSDALVETSSLSDIRPHSLSSTTEPIPSSPPPSARHRTKRRSRKPGEWQSRRQLRQVLQQANCLLWIATVQEVFPRERGDRTVESGPDASLQWALMVVNQVQTVVPSWLPVAQEQGETVTAAWLRSRDREDDITASRVAREALYNGSPRYTQTFRHRMADRGIRWMFEDVCIEEVTPAAGGPRRWNLTGIVTDVTERIEAGQQQQALAEQLRQVTERANCLLWQAEVTERPPLPGCETPQDTKWGTVFDWLRLDVVNEADVLRWLPIERQEDEPFSVAWNRARHPEDFQACNRRSQEALTTGADRYSQAFRTFAQDGVAHWLQEDVRIEALEPSEEPGPTGDRLRRWRLTGVVTDVTERKQTEEQQSLLAEDLRQIMEQANCLLWRGEVREYIADSNTATRFFDPVTGSVLTWNLKFVNEAEISRWLPLELREGETLTDAWFRTRHPEDKIQCDNHGWSSLTNGEERYFQNYRNYMADGSIRWLQEDVRVEVVEPTLSPYSPVKPRRQWRLTGVVTDITERKAAEEALWWRANHDSLTDLPNRQWIRERIDNDIREGASAVRRFANPYGALFLIDLDGFKYINDSLGHEAGDQFLQAATARLTAALQTEGLMKESGGALARLGGDEFVVWIPRLLPEAASGRAASRVRALDTASHIAELLLQAISQPTRLESTTDGRREVLMTGSIGIALFAEGGADTTTLLKNADTALYQAKEAGRGKHRFHTRERSREVSNRLTMETRLYKAVRDNELTLWYQPQVNAMTHEIVGVEALLRWEDAELGFVPPDTFIPLAEEVGLIHAIGDFTLRTACQQLALWRRTHSELRMCVNLSALQLVETGIVRVILAALEETHLPGEALELEITETALFRTGEQGASHFMREIRAQGIRLAMDDFGTGYSSLAYLRNLPVDVVKIDRGFVKEITETPQTRAIVRAIIDLAHALGLTVTAEGVETELQQLALTDLACDMLQGYLFSRPVTARYMERLLQCPNKLGVGEGE